ncbi:hypothetical protein LINPERPRIM_LOCUS38465 [Linum perenne]
MASLCLFSFAAAVLTDPGYVPPSYAPDVEGAYHEGTRAAWLAKKSGQFYRHPFNISIYGNISSVLGPNMLKWFCPTAVGHLKDGTSFPTSHQS